MGHVNQVMFDHIKAHHRKGRQIMRPGVGANFGWYTRLRDIVLKSREPASRSYRYMSRLIEQEFPKGDAGAACLAIVSPDSDRMSANAILMLSYCLQGELDSRVLIVDGRLRNAGDGLTGRLGLSGLRGYADILREGCCKGNEVIHETGVGNIHVVPAGRLERGDPVTVDRERLRVFLELVRAQYGHVLIQVGSVREDTRNLLTAMHADAVFILAQENRTLMKSVDDARKLMLNNGVRDVRVILSGDGR